MSLLLLSTVLARNALLFEVIISVTHFYFYSNA